MIIKITVLYSIIPHQHSTQPTLDYTRGETIRVNAYAVLCIVFECTGIYWNIAIHMWLGLRKPGISAQITQVQKIALFLVCA